jgi:predicted TPR repeat methyltransferase
VSISLSQLLRAAEPAAEGGGGALTPLLECFRLSQIEEGGDANDAKWQELVDATRALLKSLVLQAGAGGGARERLKALYRLALSSTPPRELVAALYEAHRGAVGGCGPKGS